MRMDAMMTDPRESQRFYLRETPTRRATVGLARLLLGPAMRLTVEGGAHLPVEGGCVIAANHLTTLDVFPIQFALSRPIFFMAKAELFANPALAWLLRKLGAFPVQRGASDQWAMDHARQVLDRGLVLGMFPEGTRSHGRGLAVAKTGAARLAIDRQVPVVPVAIDASREPFQAFPRRTPVRICVSPPIFPKPDDDPLSLMERVMFALAASLPLDLRGVYADIPPGFVG